MGIRVSFLVTVIASIAAVATLHADWAAVAAGGTIDEGDLNKIVLNNDGSAMIRPTITGTSAKIRFQLPEGPSLKDPSQEVTGTLVFTMRARDNGDGARVIATLKRVTLGFFSDTPQRTDIAATIDTDRKPPSDDWITVNAYQHSSCCWVRDPEFGTRLGLDFFDAAWFVEVQLIKNNATGNPGVLSVAIIRDEP